MMRLPYFHFRAPSTVLEAAELLAAAPAETLLVAGGTDLLPNMKRRQQVPERSSAFGASRISVRRRMAGGLTVGAGVTLTELVHDLRVRERYGALWQAAAQVATPQLRNMGTLGGNICLDTRCNYYDQNYEWRKAIDFCMKKDGAICWVATSSPTCLAVSSTDTAPALLALSATVTLVSAESTRQVAVSDLYQNDGIHHMTRRPTEILTAIHPTHELLRSAQAPTRSNYVPVLSVAAAGSRSTARSRPCASSSARRVATGGSQPAAARSSAAIDRNDRADRGARRTAGQADGQHRLQPAVAEARDEIS
jgi:4-hydroxybenzoyl-CoA reductase subunit beta